MSEIMYMADEAWWTESCYILKLDGRSVGAHYTNLSYFVYVCDFSNKMFKKSKFIVFNWIEFSLSL